MKKNVLVLLAAAFIFSCGISAFTKEDENNINIVKSLSEYIRTNSHLIYFFPKDWTKYQELYDKEKWYKLDGGYYTYLPKVFETELKEPFIYDTSDLNLAEAKLEQIQYKGKKPKLEEIYGGHLGKKPGIFNPEGEIVICPHCGKVVKQSGILPETILHLQIEKTKDRTYVTIENLSGEKYVEKFETKINEGSEDISFIQKDNSGNDWLIYSLVEYKEYFIMKRSKPTGPDRNFLRKNSFYYFLKQMS